jgi:hypothetical protein
MPTRTQVRRLADDGMDYAVIGEILGIPAGQAYLIGTGSPADGSSATRPVEAVLGSRAQSLVNPREMFESRRGDVREWVRRRAYSDGSMRQSGGRP